MNVSVEQTKEVQSFLSGQLASVDVARIEKELRHLWQEAAGGDASNAGGTVVRACSFNLILFSTEENAESQGSDLLDEILCHHPSRGILSVFRQDKPHQLSAWVSARCHLAGGSRQICSEQITVCSEGGQASEMVSVVLPLVLPDLPVFLWWRHQRIDRESFQPLIDCARRFVVDSGRKQTDPSFLSEIASLIATSHDCLWVSDLNWRRLGPWLEAMAEAFDGFPMPLECLYRIKKMSVSFAGDANTDFISAQSLLLTGWFASRLSWVPVGLVNSASANARFVSGNNEVLVEFKAVNETTSEAGSLVEVVIEFDDRRTLHAQIQQNNDLSFIVTRADSSASTESTRFHRDLSEATLVGQEVEVLSSDPVYENTMVLVANLLNMQEK